MLTQIINGRIFTPQGWLNEGSVLIRDGKILEVTNCDLALIGARLIDAKGMYIVPGFVCMHAHGGSGHDFNECTEEAFRSIVQAHLKHGATSFYPTISSSPFSKLHQAAHVCERLMEEPDSPILGLHIEGPYLSRKMAGEQFAGQVKEIDEQEYRELVENTRCIRRWDASPELPGALEFAGYLREKAYWQPYPTPKPSMTTSAPPTKPDSHMPPTSTTPCRASTNAANTNTRAQWKAST